MLQGRNSANTKPPSVSNQEQLPAGKSAAHENDYKLQQDRAHSDATLVHEAPLKQKESARALYRCNTAHVSWGFSSLSAVLPPTLNLYPQRALFSLTAITHLPSPLPVLVLPLFPAFRTVITLEQQTFDQPEQNFFIELLFCFSCVSTTMLHLQPTFLHV